MTKIFSLCLGALLLSTGCGTTVRHLTAASWVAPPGGGEEPPPAAEAAPAADAAPPAEGEAAAAAPAPAAAPAAPSGIKSKYYLTYWEGNCKPVMGCPRGETHVKRCTVNADNSVTCVEEANATKAFNPD